MGSRLINVALPLPRHLAGIATLAVHGPSAPADGGTGTPIHRSAAFDGSGPGDLASFAYSRTANPTTTTVAGRIAALEGGEAALLLGSGSAALVAALLTVVPPGGRLVAARDICGDTHRLLMRELPALGREVVLVRIDDRTAWERAAPGADALFAESLSNPMLRVADLPFLARSAHAAGARLVVDATLATPINQRPLAVGADLVVHSATKALNGHSDLTAGVVVGSAGLVAAVARNADWLGASLDPGAAALLERGLKTLALRIERQNATARTIAAWLEAQAAVTAVTHPELPSHPDHLLAARLLGGSAGLVTFGVGSEHRANRIVQSLQLIRMLTTLGGVESLATTTRNGSHANLDSAERCAAGIPAGTIRLSLGIEDVDDLVEDLERALAVPAPRRLRAAAIR